MNTKMYYICPDAWSIILQFLRPDGPSKYTNKEFLESSIQKFANKNMRGDDFYTDSRALILRFRGINLMTNKKRSAAKDQLRRMVKESKKDYRVLSISRLPKDIIDDETLFVALCYNQEISSRIKKEIFKERGMKEYSNNALRALFDRDDKEMLREAIKVDRVSVLIQADKNGYELSRLLKIYDPSFDVSEELEFIYPFVSRIPNQISCSILSILRTSAMSQNQKKLFQELSKKEKLSTEIHEALFDRGYRSDEFLLRILESSMSDSMAEKIQTLTLSEDKVHTLLRSTMSKEFLMEYSVINEMNLVGDISLTWRYSWPVRSKELCMRIISDMITKGKAHDWIYKYISVYNLYAYTYLKLLKRNDRAVTFRDILTFIKFNGYNEILKCENDIIKTMGREYSSELFKK